MEFTRIISIVKNTSEELDEEINARIKLLEIEASKNDSITRLKIDVGQTYRTYQSNAHVQGKKQIFTNVPYFTNMIKIKFDGITAIDPDTIDDIIQSNNDAFI